MQRYACAFRNSCNDCSSRNQQDVVGSKLNSIMLIYENISSKDANNKFILFKSSKGFSLSIANKIVFSFLRANSRASEAGTLILRTMSQKKEVVDSRLG